SEAGDRTLLAGDAAGAVDPVLGCGTSLALWSGLRAARAAVEIAHGRAFESARAEYESDRRRQWKGRRRLAELLRGLSARRRVARAAMSVARRSRALREFLTGVASPRDLPTPYGSSPEHDPRVRSSMSGRDVASRLDDSRSCVEN